MGATSALREYELTVIMKAELPEADLGKVLGKYEKLMTADGGEILKKDVWGSKRLAYPIKDHFRGHYTSYDFVGVPEHLIEVERLMRIDENVLRYLSVRLGEEVDIEKRKVELSKPRAPEGGRGGPHDDQE